MQKFDLFEGLTERDLEDLVLPLVSIDEYKPKISDDNIVIAFFVKDKEPATDLVRFLARSAVDILDSEVSNIPNLQGYYLVFVEMVREPKFVEDIFELVESTCSLTGITNWKYKAYKRKIADFTMENLLRDIRTAADDIEVATKNAIKETREVSSEGNKIITRFGVYTVTNVASHIQISEQLGDLGLVLTESATKTCRMIESAFGPAWRASVYDGGLILVANIVTGHALTMTE